MKNACRLSEARATGTSRARAAFFINHKKEKNTLQTVEPPNESMTRFPSTDGADRNLYGKTEQLDSSFFVFLNMREVYQRLCFFRVVKPSFSLYKLQQIISIKRLRLLAEHCFPIWVRPKEFPISSNRKSHFAQRKLIAERACLGWVAKHLRYFPPLDCLF